MMQTFHLFETWKSRVLSFGCVLQHATKQADGKAGREEGWGVGRDVGKEESGLCLCLTGPQRRFRMYCM